MIKEHDWLGIKWDFDTCINRIIKTVNGGRQRGQVDKEVKSFVDS
jgi:hypothetical protein